MIEVSQWGGLEDAFAEIKMTHEDSPAHITERETDWFYLPNS